MKPSKRDMREHELELIAALAEGRLEDEAEAHALIASSEQARAEYEAQRLAIEALAQATTVSLTDTERMALRRDVWTELRASEPATGPAKPWYYRWMPVAAGMFILVGLVAVLDQGGFDGIVAADQGAAGTTLAASETTDALAEELDGGDDSSDGAVTEAPTATTIGGEAGDGDLGAATPPAAAAFYSAEAADIRTGEETEPQTRALDIPSSSELEQCLEEAGLTEYQVQDVSPAPDEAGVDVPEEAVPYLAAIPLDADLATAEVVFVSLEMCEVIHIDR